MRMIVLAALAVTGTAFAQPASAQSLSAQTLGDYVTTAQPNGNTFKTSVDSYIAQGVRDTPAMAQRRLERAFALRTEAHALLASDGGTLTRAHRRYLQRKADAI